ncbi:MAG: hypothetical protein PUB07_05895 [Clostridia bacterium]|nr:hypothetical protein [Clostridia bacterium]
MRKTRSLVPIALFLVFLCSLVVMPAQAAETWAQGFESWNEGLPNGMAMQNGESIACV